MQSAIFIELQVVNKELIKRARSKEYIYQKLYLFISIGRTVFSRAFAYLDKIFGIQQVKISGSDWMWYIQFSLHATRRMNYIFYK